MNDEAKAGLLKMFWAWLFVGLSQMTPLQWAQFLAAIAATLYSVVQTWKIMKERKK